MAIVLVCLLAFYLAWNLGANDVANSMGTSVGSKAITLGQALLIAGMVEFVGAVWFGRAVSEKLATGVVNPALFAAVPHTFVQVMVAVLMSAGLWMNLATWFGLPVSSSHAVVGALAGVGWVALGWQAVNWQSIGLISLTWIATPLVSGTIAALFYGILKQGLLDRPDASLRLQEWIPWLSVAIVSILGVIVLPTIVQTLPDIGIAPKVIAISIALFLILLVSSIGFFTLRSHQSHYLVESVLAKFQIVSACGVAFAHGSNDVGNAIAPLAAILFVNQTHQVPIDSLPVPLWILGLGGGGIVAGLALWGRQVITTVGEGIIALQASSGFCAELATATTILLASKFGLPVSTSHALVGAVVGIGLIQDMRQVRWHTLRSIGFTWVITIPVSAGLGAIVFWVLQTLS
ncbi:MAG: anion permease [Synechococcales bacterium]|nr:anion permease [Synechococcales bacterium]